MTVEDVRVEEVGIVDLNGKEGVSLKEWSRLEVVGGIEPDEIEYAGPQTRHDNAQGVLLKDDSLNDAEDSAEHVALVELSEPLAAGTTQSLTANVDQRAGFAGHLSDDFGEDVVLPPPPPLMCVEPLCSGAGTMC